MGKTKKKIPKENWEWMPHAGHLIVGNDCRFHLATRIGKYFISTVGEYVPDQTVRKIHAEVRGVVIEGKGEEWDRNFFKKFGFLQIGAERTYETMVFKAKKSGMKCCPWIQESGADLDFDGYSDAGAAMKGHLAMCAKWSGK